MVAGQLMTDLVINGGYVPQYWIRFCCRCHTVDEGWQYCIGVHVHLFMTVLYSLPNGRQDYLIVYQGLPLFLCFSN